MFRLFFILFFSNFLIFGAGYKAIPINNIQLSQENVILQFYGGIVVDKDRIIFCDSKASDFKIFDMKGKLKFVFGRKGHGPNEFSRPVIHDYSNSILVIGNLDTYRTKLYEYKKDNKCSFIFKKEFLLRGIDAKLSEDKLLYCGIRKPDPKGKIYNLFSIDLKTNKKEYLIPFELQFGDKPIDFRRKRKQGFKRTDELIIGYNTYCDIYKKDAFFIWTGNLSVMKFNFKTKKIFRFGNNSKNYLRPYLSQELKRGYEERNIKKYLNASKKMSWVTGIFVDPRFVGVIYVNYDISSSCWVAFLDFFNRDGKFINEIRLKKLYCPYNFLRFYYDKKNQVFHGASHTIDESFNDIYRVISYKFIQ